MALVNLRATFSGNLELELEKLQASISPMALTLFQESVVVPYIKERAIQRFVSEGDSATGKWAPLKESTQKVRKYYGYGESHPINKRTGQLENFITGISPGVVAGAGTVLTFPGPISSSALEQKFLTAQQGRIQPLTVPRPVLGWMEGDVIFLASSLESFIQKGGKL